jgi:hypothetical protein
LAADTYVDCNLASYSPISLVAVVVTGDQGGVYIDVVPLFNEAGGVGFEVNQIILL